MKKQAFNESCLYPSENSDQVDYDLVPLVEKAVSKKNDYFTTHDIAACLGICCDTKLDRKTSKAIGLVLQHLGYIQKATRMESKVTLAWKKISIDRLYLHWIKWLLKQSNEDLMQYADSKVSAISLAVFNSNGPTFNNFVKNILIKNNWKINIDDGDQVSFAMTINTARDAFTVQ